MRRLFEVYLGLVEKLFRVGVVFIEEWVQVYRFGCSPLVAVDLGWIQQLFKIYSRLESSLFWVGLGLIDSLILGVALGLDK